MGKRQDVIAQSITDSILHHDEKWKSFLVRIPRYFRIYRLDFDCINDGLFRALRGLWQLEEDDYQHSFGNKDENAVSLTPIGDMGYSGSTFFTTKDAKFIVKSIPRHFEHSFFKNDMLVPYAEYMLNNPNSLLCRITNFLEYMQASVGHTLGLAPGHHIVMENILYGKDADDSKWENFDLKPMSYFYPERDVAEGKLTSEATKSKLADDFHDKIVLTLDQAEEFKAQLEKDTRLLSQCNAVDYSLFFVRIPYTAAADPKSGTDGNSVTPDKPPFVPPEPPSWRTGIRSADGKYIYRAAVLDFFWAKHKTHAKAMTALISAYNMLDRKGHMSVTTSSPEYRERFLKMCKDMVEIQSD